MADYIERQAVVNVICEMHVGGQDAVKNALPNTYGADLREIIEEIDALPSADEWAIVTEYCRKRNLVIITLESFRVLQAYYNRQNGMEGD